MTAEIAIMNKTAIALAADSAVTIAAGSANQKIYNSVNKLFTLSKYHPIGVMVYGGAELMGIPWESIIKIYRNHLLEQNFSSLEEYGKDFMDFLDKENPLFPEKLQNDYFMGAILNYFTLIKEDINKAVKHTTEQKGQISKKNIKEIINSVIEKHYKIWKKANILPHLDGKYASSILVKFGDYIIKCIPNVFQNLPILKKHLDQLKYICSNLFCKARFPSSHSGIVIAGFGEDDTFPVVNTYIVEAVVNKRLKYNKDKNKCEKISFKNSATIIPFAQSQNVATFLEGIALSCRKIIFSYLKELFRNYPIKILEKMKFNTEEEKKLLSKKLVNTTEEILNDFWQNIERFIREKNVDPIINAVAFLPKDELASMAESLVNLTSFKQKISMDSETVGGPIDVAVISKGDGFVWIRRKHYFDQELNPHYMSKYFHNATRENKNEKKTRTKK